MDPPPHSAWSVVEQIRHLMQGLSSIITHPMMAHAAAPDKGGWRTLWTSSHAAHRDVAPIGGTLTGMYGTLLPVFLLRSSCTFVRRKPCSSHAASCPRCSSHLFMSSRGTRDLASGRAWPLALAKP